MSKIKHVAAFVILSASILLVYFNSFDASWHLDDYRNIIQDARIQATGSGFASLIDYVKSAKLVGRDARPLSRFSLAVNWYFGRDDPFGYHLVNVAIHILASFFLYGTILAILRTPNSQLDLSDLNYYKISLLAALLWAINPIQTQAVTYIVQRMAALAAMFYILAMYFYIRSRTSENVTKRNLLFLGCLLSAGGAFAAKENAATLPIALLLVEFLFFQDLSRKKSRNLFWSAILAAGLVMAGLGVLIFFGGDPQGLLNYDVRYFSPVERLLTQPRVVLYYLSQIFYPVPTRLSIEHDIVVSTSLFSPWTTLPAIILVLSLIGIGLFNMKRRPLLSFAILFFFLNHVIESSVIGLELVFEHRNYLPSCFLFVPAAAGTMGLLDYYREKNRLIHRAIVTFVVVVIAGFGAGTFIRNLAWQTEKSLWEDAVAKAPKSGRAWHNLALSHYVPAGRLEEAIWLYRKALTLEKNNIHQESLIYSNMAASFYYLGNYGQAARYWTQSLTHRPANPKVKYLLSLALIRMGDYEAASKYLAQLVAKYPQKAEPLNLSGILAIFQGNPAKGLAYFKKCFKLKSRLPAVLVNAGAAHSLRSEYVQAARFFKTYLRQQPNDRYALLWLWQNSVKNGELQQADIYLNRLLETGAAKDLVSWLRRVSAQVLINDSMIAPEFDPQFKGLIAEKLQLYARQQNLLHSNK